MEGYAKGGLGGLTVAGVGKGLASDSLLHVHRHLYLHFKIIYLYSKLCVDQSSSGELTSFYACVSACRPGLRDKIGLAISSEVKNTKGRNFMAKTVLQLVQN